MFLNDKDIGRRVMDAQHPMISPYNPDCTRKVGEERVISMGQAPCGYDAQLAPHLKLFLYNPTFNGVIDPKNFEAEQLLTEITGELILPAKTYALGETLEWFNMPKDLMAICMAKSTYARNGISVNTTPIMPGFSGHVVLEIYNHTDYPVKLYPNEGFAFFVFLASSEPCALDYAERGGNYMGQEPGIQVGKV